MSNSIVKVSLWSMRNSSLTLPERLNVSFVPGEVRLEPNTRPGIGVFPYLVVLLEWISVVVGSRGLVGSNDAIWGLSVGWYTTVETRCIMLPFMWAPCKNIR